MDKKYILKPEGEQPSEICFVEFGEEHKASMKIAEIRLEGKLRIFDIVQESDNIIRHRSKTPQYIVIEQKLTHELLENADPYIIGSVILDAYRKLKIHISKYANGLK